jgi:hypothetical protein
MRKPLAALAALLLTAWVAHADDRQATAQDQGARIKELQKDWLAAVRAVAREDAMRAKDGQALPDDMQASTRLLAEAELAACESDKERAIALEDVLVTARETERLAEALARSGQGRAGTALKAKAERLRFEIALERAKANVAAKPVGGDASQALRRGRVALAEKQAAIKQAAVKVTEAQRAKAQASLATLKAQVAQAKAAESYAEMQLQRFKDLLQTNAIEERLLGEQRSTLEGARARRVAVEAQVAEAESQVAIEQARVVQAQLEFEEAQLRLEQLKARLQSR